MRKITHDSQGVALVAALFVLVAISILVAGILTDVQNELKMTGIERNSERALKIAEAGVQIARANFMREDLFENLTSTQDLASVDGFFQGGYFFASLGSGLVGDEKWVQWHYDAGITGYNTETEVTWPLRRVWATGSRGQNGSWREDKDLNLDAFYLNNLYGLVAGGTYFPIEAGKDTKIRAHDEYTGEEIVTSLDGTERWRGDKNLADTKNNSYAVGLSPLASYSEVKDTVAGKEIDRQVLYFTYQGDTSTGTASTTTDTTSTVRLRAVNALCNPSTQTAAKKVWEFDTGRHGIGTAPAFFDPTPGDPGDEILYFAVIESPDVDYHVARALREYPNNADKTRAEQIYLYAVIDTSGDIDCDTTSGTYQLKWAHPYPDPDVAEWTDYPTEQATGTNGQQPPYVRHPSDMTPFLPEDDLLFDYRDGTDHRAPTAASDSATDDDGRQNHVRGNVYNVFDPPSLSPPVLTVLYRGDHNEDGTTGANEFTPYIDRVGDNAAQVADPFIDIYLMYSAYTHLTDDEVTPYWNGANLSWSRVAGDKKQAVVQSRIFALRDRLDGTVTIAKDTDGNITGYTGSWNWNKPKSRFPTLKWTYRLPAWDPKLDDARPWNGYGEFTWDTWFEQQIAPMINVVEYDQDDTAWAGAGGGQRNLYPVLYPSYESMGYLDAGGYNNSEKGPATTNGSPEDFSTDNWDDSHLMVMAVRDTWDDYMAGNQTNPLFGTTTNTAAVEQQSAPVEHYWTFKYDDKVCKTDGSDINATYPNGDALITYPQYAADASNYRINFPRPYTWWEALWKPNVKNGTSDRNLTAQGWTDVPTAISDNITDSIDLDVEGETSAFCRECLDHDGLLVQVFNHDLKDKTKNREDLRVHGINSRSGAHIWDYHMAAKFAGDYFNATPAIGNGYVFVAYQNERETLLEVLDADSGAHQQTALVDNDSDAIVLAPAVANGAVYVGTYDFNETNLGNPNKDMTNDVIRLFTLSPVLRLVSTGIYPMTTSLELESQIGKAHTMPRAERKLQVWISGGGSKWEEIREEYQ